MNKITYRIARHQPECPQNYQYQSNCPQHKILLSDFSFPRRLATLAPADRGDEVFLFFRLELLDGHPVIDTLHTVYVVSVFGGQIFFGCAAGLATQRDYSALRFD